MKLLFYNIAHGTNPSRSFFSQVKQLLPVKKDWTTTLVDEIKDIQPSIIAFVEVDSGSLRARGKNHLKDIAQQLEYSSTFFSKYRNRLIRRLPIFRKLGAAVLHTKDLAIQPTPIYFRNGHKKMAIKSTFDYRAEQISLYVLHLSLLKKTRNKQLQEFKTLLESDENKKIIVGDLNLFKGAQELDSFLDHTNLSIHTNNQPTFPTWNPHLKLDYLIYSKGIRITDFQLEPIHLSDHLPFSFSLALTPSTA